MKRFLLPIFYVMSPFFPGNNWLEIALIGALAGYLSPALPFTVDLGVLRSGIYLVYNIIAIVGLVLCSEQKATFSFKVILEVTVALGILFLSGYAPEPWGTAILTVCGIYFLYPYLISGKRWLQRKLAQ